MLAYKLSLLYGNLCGVLQTVKQKWGEQTSLAK